jgi:phosphoribosylformylglycinamidine synthase
VPKLLPCVTQWLCLCVSAGNCGIKVDLPGSSDPFAALFAEELGLVLEVAEGHAEEVMQRFTAHGVACSKIGQVGDD